MDLPFICLRVLLFIREIELRVTEARFAAGGKSRLKEERHITDL